MNDIISQQAPAATATGHHPKCSGEPHELWCPLSPCPPWCTTHPMAGEGALADPRGWHKTADCPSWCIGHRSWLPEPGPGEAHTSAGAVVGIGGAPWTNATWMDRLDTPSFEVSVWLEDAGPAVVTVRTDEDTYLPDMTPREARQLAQALLAAADMAAEQPDARLTAILEANTMALECGASGMATVLAEDLDGAR